MVYRKNRRRVNDFRSEVAKLHGLDERKAFDEVGVAYDFGVCRQKAVHVGPYLQHFGSERRCHERSGIVRTAAAQIRGIARSRIRGDESAHYGNAVQLAEILAYETLRQRLVHRMLAVVGLRLYDRAGVEVSCSADGSADDDGREPFSVANYRIASPVGQIADKKHSVENL